MPDVIQIGNHAYALTLNLFVTVLASVVASIVYFKWKRRIEREDQTKRELIEQREKNDAAYLGTVQTITVCSFSRP